VPDVVADWVRAAGGRRTAIQVLLEDCYESLQGDGKFLYPEAIFLSEAAFHEFLTKQARENTYYQQGLRSEHRIPNLWLDPSWGTPHRPTP